MGCHVPGRGIPAQDCGRGLSALRGRLGSLCGYSDLAKLALAVERDLDNHRLTPTHTTIATATPEVATSTV